MSRDYPTPLDSSRRTVMKALGAGSALSLFGGSAMAQEDDGTDGDGPMTETPTDDGDDADGPGSVYEVQTLISGPPTNPERPADFFYHPTGLHVQPGDVVKFVFTTPDHNVVSYHPAFGMRRRVPTGVDAFSSPLLGFRPESIPGDQREPPALPGEGGEEGGDGGETPGTSTGGGADADEAAGPVPDTWLHAFETPGVYDLFCSPHETFGMAMRVVVGDETETQFETSDADALPEPRAGPVGLARTTLTDPALQPANVVEQGSVQWQELEAVQSGGDGGTPTPGTDTGTNETAE